MNREPRPKRGRPARTVLDRRDLIIPAALRLFAVQGYERTGLKDIAKAAGVTHPALYHYYQSKGQLVFEAVTFAMGQLISRLRVVDANAFATRSKYLAELVRVQAAFEIESSGISPFINSVLYGPLRVLEDLTPAQKAGLRALQRELVEIYNKVLRDGVANKEFELRSTTAAAFSILGMVSHLAMWFKPGGELSADAVAALLGQLTQRMAGDRAA